MITKIELDNFKSFCDFELLPGILDLPAFVVLIGLNGSGKSTLLQALGFLASLIEGGPSPWLVAREWSDEELASRFKQQTGIAFKLHFKFADCECPVIWSGTYEILTRRCHTESITAGDAAILNQDTERFTLHDDNGTAVLEGNSASYTYSGSILSIIAEPKAHRAFLAVKKFMAGIKPLELLSPEQLRKRARQGEDIGLGGEKLSAFLHDLDEDRHSAILEKLQEFYPRLVDWKTKTIQSGWKDLATVETYLDASGANLETGARHVNDGLLRLLAILAQTRTDHSALLFDEIENGINPELVEALVKILLASGKQIFVTTHSPMVLNYLADDEARGSVVFMYRNRRGYCRAKRFFDIQEAGEKLALLGPGEVFIDTDLIRISEILGEQEDRP